MAFGISAAVLAVLLLAGCATSSDVGAATPSPSESPVASPTPTPTPDLPVLAFGGDCSTMLDEDVVTATFGSPARPLLPSPVASPPQALLGGLACTWRSDVGWLTAVALPVGSVPPSWQESFTETLCHPTIGMCRGSVTSGDLWLQLRYYFSSSGDPSIEIESLLEVLAASAAAHPGAAPAIAEPGWWALPACDELSAGIDVASILGAEAVVPEYPADDVLPDEILPALEAAGLEGWCAWTALDGEGNYGASLQLYVWPGAAEGTQPLLDGDGFESVEIAGADRASLREQTFPSPDVVYATAGQNAVRIFGWSERANVLAFAEAVMVHLDAGQRR